MTSATVTASKPFSRKSRLAESKMRRRFSAIFSRLTFMSHSPAALTWDRTYDPNMTFVINIGRDSQKSNRAGFPASSHHRRADASHHREHSATGEPYARSIRNVGDIPRQAAPLRGVVPAGVGEWVGNAHEDRLEVRKATR